MASSEPMGVPFSTLLKVLESEGYRLVRISGSFRYFDPPRRRIGKQPRRIGFPVHGGRVSQDHVNEILQIIQEDKGPAT